MKCLGRRVLIAIWVCAGIVSWATSATAEQLPTRLYTTADGLARDQIVRIVQDSKGFLWFCTVEGLSRFDGVRFSNYAMADGLPAAGISDILLTRSGTYWVATRAGLSRFNPLGISQTRRREDLPGNGKQTAQPMFETCPPESGQVGSVNALFEDRQGVVWCGTGRGLYRLRQGPNGWALQQVDIGLAGDSAIARVVHAIAEDNRGRLWIGAGSGLFWRTADGHTGRISTHDGLPVDDIRTLLIVRGEQLWVGTIKGLSRILFDPTTGTPARVSNYTDKDGLIDKNIRSLAVGSNGELIVGTPAGLSRLREPAPGADPGRLIPTISSVIGGVHAASLAEDSDGNLWIGTDNGAIRVSRNGFTSYTNTDGLARTSIQSVFENNAGEICATNVGDGIFINRLAGKRFVSTKVGLPAEITYFGWGAAQLTLQDHRGDWWVPTGQGLCRFQDVGNVEALSRVKPQAIYTARDGLISDDVYRLYEDARGNIWIATFSDLRNGISRWERSTGRIHTFTESEGIPASIPIPRAFCEDRAGNLWIGFEERKLARFKDGRFTLFDENDGVPRGWVNALHVDRAGRLWMAASEGSISRIDDPAAAHPRFISYTPADGISSIDVWCIAEDRFGLLYFGTGRGVDRLDPLDNSITHYTSANGLVRGEIRVAASDRNGRLWFGGANGLSRLDPEPEKPAQPPIVLINTILIAGVRHPMSELGEVEISEPQLNPDQNNIEVEFSGLCLNRGDTLRYQYQLEGADQNWSAVTDQRRVNYANLSPGSYRFQVRAVSPSGSLSQSPALFSFTILPPIWRRWWFIGSTFLLTGFVLFTIARMGVRRRLEVERIRTRIASDLHDDIGSNLSLIAGLTEVLSGHARKFDTEMTERLTLIAGISRSSLDAMSDIVWAVNPCNDHLADLIRRMRRFAGDSLDARNISFHFDAKAAHGEIPIGAEARREIFLIFKESINNLVRHSCCSRAEIALESHRGDVVLKISDNGKGFDVGGEFSGQGLLSLRRRAAKLGGKLTIESKPQSGTAVVLRVPIA